MKFGAFVAAVLIFACSSTRTSATELAAGSPGACAPTPSLLPFAPPIDRPLQLLVKTSRPARDGSLKSFGMEYRLEFRNVGRGLGLSMTLVRLDPGEVGDARGSMRAIFGPLIGRPIDFLVSDDGQTLLLQDGDRLWKMVSDDLAATAARSLEGEARTLGNVLASLPLAQREALIAADIRQMLRFAGRDWSGKYETDIALSDQPCGLIMLVERGATSATSEIFASRQRWMIDSRSGLVRTQSEERWLQRGNRTAPELAAQTERTLTPVE